MSSVISHLLSVVNTVYAVEINVGFGGPSGGTGENIAEYVGRIYMFGVGIAGILAVGVIVFGAIYYAVSGGNPDKQRDARSYITSALWGLALLLGSYLILNTINPQITTLSTLQQTKICTPGENPKESGCIPEAPKPCKAGEDPKTHNCFKPACKAGQEPARDNCRPPCTESQRACGLGEEAGNTRLGDIPCTICSYPEPARCADKIVISTPVGNVTCRPGTYEQVMVPGEVTLRVPYFTLREIGFKDENFNNGVARFAPYYPASKDPSAAQCIIYAYIKELKQAEVSTSTTEGQSNIESTRWEKIDSSNLKQC